MTVRCSCFFYDMLDLVAVNRYVLHKACSGWKGTRLLLSLLAKEFSCQFMSQKVTETERNATSTATAFATALPGAAQTYLC